MTANGRDDTPAGGEESDDATSSESEERSDATAAGSDDSRSERTDQTTDGFDQTAGAEDSTSDTDDPSTDADDQTTDAGDPTPQTDADDPSTDAGDSTAQTDADDPSTDAGHSTAQTDKPSSVPGQGESPPGIEAGGVRIREIERAFSLVEGILGMDALDSQQTRQVLGILERALATPAQTDPDVIAEFLTLLEETLLDHDLDQADLDALLSVFEHALAATMRSEERSEEVMSVVESAVQDPSSVTPEDVERLRSGLEQTILELTSPHGEYGQLFGPSGAEGYDAGAFEDEQLDSLQIARLAAGMTQRATGYSLESGVRIGTRLAYAAMNAESPAQLLTEARAITLDELQRSGVDIGEEQQEWLEAHEDTLVDTHPASREQLRARGERLLSRSAEVGRDEAFHPAFPSILDGLAADEARILRLLAQDGIQACMDVYDRHYIPFTSTLIARHLSMVGTDAGCRHPERTPIYLQNLERLGLIRFSEDPVEDLKRYQVLDAQPHIEAAIEKAKRPKTDYGAIHLTEFGLEFCETCLPVELNHDLQRRRFRGEEPDEG